MSPIEVETGPMFSGKTSELLTQAERFIVAGNIQGVDFLAFNHFSDERYGKNLICSHNKISIEAIPAKSSSDIFSEIFEFDDQENIVLLEGRDLLSAIFIDEGQFFDNNLPDILNFINIFYRNILNKNINIYCAGLDMDFRGEPFGPMPKIMAIAEKVNKFTAVCKECPKDTPSSARYTQRLINNRPAKYTDPIVLVGASENYTARCFKHHSVPGKPKPNIDHR